ncbi:hypothetical protein CN957_09535 [Bacillus cereus]|uniref:2,3-bisphosphoglycerate-dependent phosphoglycerate mutase n=1 Tax=Bacillus nitratireducens TaxID=2026193 RepID=UPI000BF478D1|nr:hypothetical protein COI95_25825 [Bacillus cereus]PFK04554.1 hypothetical protein COI97_09740 [Bacillus cereus]PGM83173.1 hypothetical protein CN957_09535 [Bacillus cereus]
MVKLVLIRHGQSEWNVENRFTGWTDVDLSNKGLEEAREAGVMLKANGFSFDIAFTSVLRRAMRTLWITLEEMDLMWIPVHKTWKLNERHYGALQGLNKEETARKYGDEQVIIAAHGNTIRALVKHLDQISDEDIENVNIPTGTPLVYELDNDLKPIDHYYLNREIYIK